MTNIQIFKNGTINLQIKEVDGEIYFDAEQTAIGLGISFVAKSGNEVARWERVRKYLNSPQVEKGDFITEPQFYKLAIKANNETAEKFQNWVTSEVLPTIRKHGAYLTEEKIDEVLSDPDTIIKLATQLKEERQARKQLQADNERMRPKEIFSDAVSASHTDILIGELAKILKGNGIEIGQNRLFTWLRENGYLIRRKGTDYNMPTQKSMENGLFRIKETAITHSDGHVSVSKTPKVTGSGQVYFVNKFLKMKARGEIA
jgi:anti-repressor protein